MQRVVIIATLTKRQLNYLRNLAQQQNIAAEIILEGQQQEQVQPKTPITGEMLDNIATSMGKTLIEVATIASKWGITTLEEALNNEEVPNEIKEILENYL